MTTLNVLLLAAATAFIGSAMQKLSTDWVSASVEFAIGIAAIIVYEKLPPSVPPQA